MKARTMNVFPFRSFTIYGRVQLIRWHFPSAKNATRSMKSHFKIWNKWRALIINKNAYYNSFQTKCKSQFDGHTHFQLTTFNGYNKPTALHLHVYNWKKNENDETEKFSLSGRVVSIKTYYHFGTYPVGVYLMDQESECSKPMPMSLATFNQTTSIL